MEIVNSIVPWLMVALIWGLILEIILWQIVHRFFLRKQAMQQYIAEKTLPIKLEMIDNMWFGWHNDNNEFICQGCTTSEFVKNFQHRYPEKIGVVVDGTQEAIERFKNEIGASIGSTP